MQKIIKTTLIVLASIVSIAILGLGVFGLWYIFGGSEGDTSSMPTAQELSVKMEEYYETHQTYPLSLTDLTGVTREDISKGETEIYLLAINAKGVSSTAYPGLSAPSSLKPVCAYEITKQKSEFGLNPQTFDSASNNRCN